MSNQPTLLLPDWPAPSTVGAFVTTRETGPSQGPYAAFNPAMHVGDDPATVALCRDLLIEQLDERRPLLWLDQVHGANVVQQYQPEFAETPPSDDPLLPEFAGSAQSDDRLSPKLGVTVKLANDVLLYANYAQGFRAPTPYQVNNFFENLAYGYTSLPNPDLGPETSESWEAGIKFSTEAVSLQIAAFTADYDDFISQQVVGGSFTPMDPAQYQFVNYDAVAIDGVEAKANFRMGNGFYSRFAIAYADGDILSPGQAPAPLDTIDPLNLVLGIGYREPQGRFGGELIATHHARKPLDETDGGYRPDAFTILDATAFFAVTDALKLRAGIFNIFDENYAYWQDVRGLSATSTTTDAYTRPGRNASVSLSFQF